MSQDNKSGNPFAKIPLELWLMLASVSGDTAKTQELLQQPVNWDLLLQLAVHHRVYPMIYKNLNRLNCPAVPEHFLGLLRKKYQENTLRAMNMAGETVRIVKCFESHGIRPVVLKGVPLAQHLYDDIAIRPSKDIDILVSPEEIEKVQDIMEKNCYRRIYTQHNLTSRQLEIFNKIFPHSHHFNYWHSEKNIYIEVHWKLGSGEHALPLPTGNNIKRIGVAGSLLPVLSDGEWLLYLMLHGAVHAWFRLRWLVDIARFAQRINIDWDKTALLAKNIGIQPIFYQSLILANQLLEMPVPPNILYDRQAWQLACLAMHLCLSEADDQITGGNGQHTNQLRKIYGFHLCVGWKNKFKYVLNLFSPNVNDIKRLPLPDRLHGLYYVTRPLFSLGRCLRKLRAGN